MQMPMWAFRSRGPSQVVHLHVVHSHDGSLQLRKSFVHFRCSLREFSRKMENSSIDDAFIYTENSNQAIKNVNLELFC
jgi:hypothetical protein